MDSAQLEELQNRAREVARRAYAPASKFHVGAALRARDGRVFTGCNVEIASLGLTICAERNAVFHAVAEGVREFEAIVVCTPTDPPGSPCGACRQVLVEFAPELDVVLIGSGDTVVETSADRLLPDAFRFDYDS